MFRSSSLAALRPAQRHRWKWWLAALVGMFGSAGAYAQCQVNYTQAWSNGNVAHGANVEIRNLGAPINGWTLRFNFVGGQTLQNGWPVTVTQAGTTLTAASNAPWNANLATNGSFTVGFNANGPFSPVPTAFTLNGVACNGGPPPPVNTPPTVSITSPAAGSTAGTFVFSANAADTNAGGAVQRVEFRVDNNLVATDTAAPYTTNVAGLAAGSHTLTATAFDNGVPAPVMSAAASLTIVVGGQPGNPPPTVAITAPANNTSVVVGTTVPFSANAADTAPGVVQRVEFRLDGTLLVSDTAAPYTTNVNTTGLSIGAHTLSAQAFDNGVPAPVASSAVASVTLNVTQNAPTPSIQPTPNSLTLAGGASGPVIVRLSAAPAAGVTVVVAVTRNAGGSTAITAAPASLSFNSTNWNTGLTVNFSAAAGTTAATATFALTSTGYTAGSVLVTRSVTGQNALFRVNANGRITKNGTVFPVHCGSWFGIEGRHEPSTDMDNPRGAPMEQYVGNTFYANGGAGTNRTVAQTMSQISGMGINMIRLPVVPQALSGTDPQGVPLLPNGRRVFKNHASVIQANSRAYINQMITAADAANIEVLLDIHSCSNFVGWRKGRLDARPPWVDRDRENYDFKREDASCSNTGNPAGVTQINNYNTTLWLNDLRTLAGIGGTLGVDNIIGIDIYNEPHDYTWAEWKSLTEQAFTAINAVNPNILLFVEGVGTTPGTQDGTPATVGAEPHGNTDTNPNWGENLFSAGTNPLALSGGAIAQQRIVFSPHTYGPSVFVQKMFMDPTQTACTGLEGDAAGNADCRIVINPTLLRAGWEEHFGYLKNSNFAIVVGEFGGNIDWPQGQANLRDRERWSHITPGVDGVWQNTFVDYMISRGIEGCYWSINPESGDTAGWYGHAYNPISNPSGWGEWQAFDARKTALLTRLWQGVP